MFRGGRLYITINENNEINITSLVVVWQIYSEKTHKKMGKIRHNLAYINLWIISLNKFFNERVLVSKIIYFLFY